MKEITQLCSGMQLRPILGNPRLRCELEVKNHFCVCLSGGSAVSATSCRMPLINPGPTRLLSHPLGGARQSVTEVVKCNDWLPDGKFSACCKEFHLALFMLSGGKVRGDENLLSLLKSLESHTVMLQNILNLLVFPLLRFTCP